MNSKSPAQIKPLSFILAGALNGAAKIKRSKPLYYVFMFFTGFFILSAVLLTSLLFANSYSINPNIKHSVNVMPKDAVAYFEVKNIEALAKLWAKSETGRAMKDNNAWRNLQDSPALRKLTSVLYFLQLKSGFLADSAQISSFFNNTAGLGLFERGQWIGVARTNLKTRLGAALLSSFRSQKVTIAPPAPEVTNSNDSAAVYSPALAEETVAISNLKVSKIMVSNEAVFFVLVDDYLFVGNDLPLMKRSIELASKPSSNSLASEPGFDDATKEFENGDVHALVYFNNSKSFAAPLLNIMELGAGTAFTIEARPGSYASAKVFAIGKNPKGGAAAAPKETNWAKYMPLDSTLTFISYGRNPDEIYKSFRRLDDSHKSYYTGITRFFNAASIDPGKVFEKTSGFAFTLDDIKTVNDKPAPQFSFLYRINKPDFSITKAMFNNDGTERQNYQKLIYYTLKHPNRKYYSPSYTYLNGLQIQSSATYIMQDYISVFKGNQPALSDASSFGLLGAYKNAPYHVIVNVNSLFENLIYLYNYGADKSPQYSRATIQKDVLPLFEPFRNLRFVHFAAGLHKNPVGMVVLSE